MTSDIQNHTEKADDKVGEENFMDVMLNDDEAMTSDMENMRPLTVNSSNAYLGVGQNELPGHVMFGPSDSEVSLSHTCSFPCDRMDGEPAELDSLSPDILNRWIDALISDNLDLVKTMLSSTTNRSLLLNARLVCHHPPSHDLKLGMQNTPHFSFSTPLATVFVYGSLRVAQFLLEQGIDVLQLDEKKNNVLHSLIGVASLHPEMEHVFNDTVLLLKQYLNTEEFNKLLLMENGDGLRPMEFAAHVGTFSLVKTILEAGSVYLAREEQYGLQVLQYFDITEYESLDRKVGYRRHKSPVTLLMLLDESLLDKDTTRCLWNFGPIQNWVHAKQKTAMPAICAWLFLRLVMMTWYFVIATYSLSFRHSFVMIPSSFERNTTLDSLSAGLKMSTFFLINILALGVIGALFVLYDILDYTYYNITLPKWMTNIPRGKKDIFVNYELYRLGQFLFNAGVLTWSILKCVMFWDLGDVPLSFTNIVSIFTTFGAVWAFLYFVQVIPCLGHFIIAIHGMMRQWMQFMTIFMLCFVPYVFIFWMLLRENELGEAPIGFQTFSGAFWGTVKVMVNMFNMDAANVTDQLSLAWAHILFIFFIAIMMVNFMVAIMTDTYSFVSKHRDIINRIQCLSVAYVMEMRLMYFNLGFLLQPFQRNHFVCKDGRIYITRLTMKHK